MPRPTLSESVHKLEDLVKLLQFNADNDRLERQWLKQMQVEDRADLHKLDNRLTILETRFTEWKSTQESKLDDLKKAHEEAERRRWQLLFLFVGCVLTLIANLVITIVRR